MKWTRYKFQLSSRGAIEVCPSIHETDHTKLPCCECGGPSWAHAFLETSRAVHPKDVDQHADRVPICRKCYDKLTPFAALEGLTG